MQLCRKSVNRTKIQTFTERKCLRKKLFKKESVEKETKEY